MAEVAANTIGANGRLVRVGADYHDLGKSLQPKYFIENVSPGETSPHDSLPPEVSCDAIFAHVTEGVRLGRKEGLPERVVDFMHMHHGDGLLAYFWSKCQEQGNPEALDEEDFRYPGVKPQTRETAILAICDAVEAASRTLKQPEARAIENLVQRIVYGKLHLGQLDESSLSMSDLRRVSNSLIETIKHAHHVRVEYPWQREQREDEKRERDEEQLTEAASPRGLEAAAARRAPALGRSATQRILSEPPLDSLDLPRAYWRAGARERTRNDLGNAATERVSTDQALARGETTTTPDRPATDPEALVEADQPALSETPVALQRAESPAEAVAIAPAAEEGSGRSRVSRPDAVTEAPPLNDPHKRVTRPVDAAQPEPEPRVPPPQAMQPVATTLPGPVGEAVAAAEPEPAAEPEQSARPTEPVAVESDDNARPTEPQAVTLPGPAMEPPPPPGSKRAKRSTIELMKDDDDAPTPLAELAASDAAPSVESHRAQSEDGSLEPGVMVVGPPPKTLTRRGAKDDD
jgi:putative nucleotidyltransferase with HDIG domain